VGAAFLAPFGKQQLEHVAFVPLGEFGAEEMRHGEHEKAPALQLGAWRFFLGLRTSWMSREILAFGLFAAAAAISTGANFGSSHPMIAMLVAPANTLTAVLGLIAVACSAMIYVDTRRPFWAGSVTFPKFFGTTLLLGASGAAAMLAIAASPAAVAMLTFATIIRLALFTWESIGFVHAARNRSAANHRPALKMWRLQRPLLLLRLSLFALTMMLAVATALNGSHPLFATVSFAANLLSQFIERYSFFTTVEAPRMPGVVA
jgi:formate dehydrogenase iron-sulfur subunit